MVRKKKYLNILLFTLFVTFFGITLGSTCNAALYRFQYEYDEMEQIIDDLNLEYIFSGDLIYTVTDTFNQWARTQEAKSDFTFDEISVVFFKNLNSGYLYWYLVNGTSTPVQNTYNAIYLKSQISYTTSNSQIGYCSGFAYNSYNNITGFANTGNLNYYYITAGNPTSVNNPTNSSYEFWINSGDNSFSYTRNSAGHYEVYLPYTIIGLPNMNEYVNFPIYMNTTFNGYMVGYLVHRMSTVEPTGTPTVAPTSNPTGGSTDLTETNGLISNVVNSLVQTPSGDDFVMPTSGEMGTYFGVPDMAIYEKVQATDNFWYTLTSNLSTALNDTSRYYTIDFLSHSYTIDNQKFNLTDINNQTLKTFITLIVVVSFVIVEYVLIRKIVNMFQSGVFSQIYRAYSRIDITDLF